MKTTVRLTESAVMLAVAFVLSLIPVVQMPFGGDVTLASMLPVLIIAFRHGVPWGLLVGLAGSLLQLLTGLDNLSYATSAGAAVAIIVLDYLVAFTATGLGGVFRGGRMSQTAKLIGGILLCCAIRYVCHVISGCTVWAGVSIPDAQGLLYSLTYNAAYMIPETIITVAAGTALSLSLDLQHDLPRRAPAAKGKPVQLMTMLAAVVSSAVGAVWLFGAMQTEDGFAVTAVTGSDMIGVGVCAVLTVLAAAVALLVSRKSAR